MTERNRTHRDSGKPVFVLVHGGWHGGWCYGRTARILREKGYEAHAPTLTGLADRAHLLARSIDLQTHVDDIARFIEWEDLNNVVLCGHSYGGVVISGVVEKVRGRLAALSFIDAAVPGDGQSLLDTLPPDREQRFREGAEKAGYGWLIPAVSATYFNVNAEDRAWVDRMCGPHPLKCFQQPVRLTDAQQGLPRQYILATDFPGTSFPATAARLREAGGWSVAEIHTGHDVMVDDPRGLAKLLVEAAGAGGESQAA